MSGLVEGLTWAELAKERCPRRLCRGKHFTGDVRALQKEAIAASRQLGCPVRTVRDDFLRFGYLWVQFADHEVPLGEPCPACGSRELVRKHEQFGYCPACQCSLAFSQRVVRTESRETSTAPVVEEGASKTTEGPSKTTEGPSKTTEGPSKTTEGPSKTTEGPSQAADGRGKLERKRPEQREHRINSFTDARLALDPEESTDAKEIWYGRATYKGIPVVMRVVYPLKDGNRVPDPDHPGSDLHIITYGHLYSYQRATELGIFDD